MAQNYRSTSTILDAANSIIDNNELRIKKDLFTNNDKGDKIIHFHGKDDRQEADWISHKILDMKDTGARFDDFAVLVRSSYLTRAVEQSFVYNKISYVIWGGVRFFERKEIKDALSYLRLIAFDDDLSFRRIVNIPSRKIGEKSLGVIEKCAHENGCSLFEALRRLSCTRAFNKEPVHKFIGLIDTARTLSDGMSISNLLEYVLANSGLNELYRTDEEEERLENLNELIQYVKTYEDEHKDDEISLPTYLQEIALYTNLDASRDKDHVKVMTIHQSKGLEFPYVFITGLSDGIMPNKRSVRERKKSGMEEERRLMYVASTRAEKRLFLTESEGYSVQGGFNKVPSRFIREIKEGLRVTEGNMDESLWDRAAVFSRSMDTECGIEVVERKRFVEGDEVVHDHFGSGIIMNIYDGGEYCEVNFFDSGTRSLKMDKLKKISK
jgi:DNA helicase-2/ATP-dependent DNA helicase PcrA